MDTDDYFWLPTDPCFTQKRPVEERLMLMQHDIDEAENAVISGPLAGWGNPLMKQFTLAVRLYTDTDTRISRVIERDYKRFGNRIMEGGDMNEAHLAFQKWTSDLIQANSI